MSSKLIKFLAFVAGLQLIIALGLFTVTKGDTHAVFGMGIGLFIFWIIMCGLLMRKYRNTVKDFVLRIRLNWQLKFVLFATLLALLEEAVTTAMTNTAPLYGVTVIQAHITASANYLDVVLTHSVVLFVPMFCIWAWILSKYDVSPNAVFLLWGLSGTFIEIISGGPQHIFEIGMWVFVYGLMIYLPAYSIPANRPVKKPRWWNYAFFIFIVLIGVIPGGIIASIIKSIRPPHFFPGFS